MMVIYPIYIMSAKVTLYALLSHKYLNTYQISLKSATSQKWLNSPKYA